MIKKYLPIKFKRSINMGLTSMLKDIIKRNKILFIFAKFIQKNTSYKYNEYRRKKIFLRDALDALYHFDDAMKELNIHYWLQFGTLLGAVRERGFIPHDFDIDVGISIDSYSPDIEKVLNKFGFKRTRLFLIDDGTYGREETYTYKSVNIDIFYFSIKNNTMFCHAFTLKNDKGEEKTIEELGGFIVREISYAYKGFTTIKFYNRYCSIAINSEEHLIADYGKNYMIPDPGYSTFVRNNVTYLTNKVGVFYDFNSTFTQKT